MKVLLVNGSPKANGNTARALTEVAEQLNAEGIDTEVFQLGAKPIRDCIGLAASVASLAVAAPLTTTWSTS